jgi:hypothetical protein
MGTGEPIGTNSTLQGSLADGDADLVVEAATTDGFFSFTMQFTT